MIVWREEAVRLGAAGGQGNTRRPQCRPDPVSSPILSVAATGTAQSPALPG